MGSVTGSGLGMEPFLIQVLVLTFLASCKASHGPYSAYAVLVQATYLNAEINVPIYMRQQPPGYKKVDILACKLNKALYGTKQAARALAAKL